VAPPVEHGTKQTVAQSARLKPQRTEPAYNPAAGIIACDLRILVEARCRAAARARARACFGLARAAAPVLATHGALCAPLFFAVAIGRRAASRLHPS